MPTREITRRAPHTRPAARAAGLLSSAPRRVVRAPVALARAFFERPTLTIARELLGALLVWKLPGGTLVARIVETEAYVGEDDPACHAAPGRTVRNAVMYGRPGHAYIYFIYGMHHCLNVVTEKEGFPAAVLIRAAEPLEGLPGMRRNRGVERPEQLANGPGKLAQAFGLTRAQSGLDLTKGPLLLAKGPPPPERIGVSPRIGIRKAMDFPWRFYLEGNPNVSR